MPAIVVSTLSLLLLMVSLINVVSVPSVQAAPSWGLPASASCAALAQLDRSATNGGDWGRTLLAGHNAPGGWFGVDVCGNGINASAPNGANVSCDRLPDNWAKTGCAPGGATSDGYGLTFQCVELIIRFSAWAFGDSASSWGRSGYGNAPDLWLPQNHPADWVMYPNGSSHAPVPGDILVWGELDAQGRPYPAGPTGAHDGHIAVVAGVRDGVVITAEQNVKWGTNDHPSDTLALNKVGPQWILSGSNLRATHLPTYRWQSTMGTTRATYGWLHNVRNTGLFPAKNVPTTAKPAKPAATPTGKPAATPAGKPVGTPAATTAAPTQPSGGLPSLADSAVVTTNGMLADLSWSKTDLFATATTGNGPSAHVRSLGAPPGVHLIANQTVSTVQLPDGTRYRYAVGADGHLYSARTAPDLFGVQWTDLGAPAGTQLQPSTAASAYAGGVGVVALGTDGNLWWRAGPASSPGGWLPAGHPDATTLAGGFGLAGQPGSGSPLLLALGQNGRVYERVWQPAMLNPDGSTQVPAGWSEWLALHAQLAAVHITGRLLLVPELQNTRSWLGAWPDAPLDVLASDTLGNLWWMRSVSASTGWTFSAVRAPHPITSLFAAVTVTHDAPSASPAPSGTPSTSATPAATTTGARPASALHLYAATVAGPYLAAIALPALASSGAKTPAQNSNGQPVWTPLAALPAAMSSASACTALALGTDASVLVAPMGDEVLVGGSSTATSTLQATNTLAIAPASGASNPWLDVGSIAGAAPFADALAGTTVDQRWYLAGTGAAASPSTHGLRLAPGSAGVAALLQSASAGDATVQVQVTLPTQGGANVTGGLLLYLDGSDWLTFTASGAAHLAFCVTTREVAVPCQGTTLKTLPAGRTLWLRVMRAGGAFTGAYSVDGQSWVAVGSWSVPSAATAGHDAAQAAATATPSTPSPAASATRTATATPAGATNAGASAQPAAITDLAPTAFTQWGLYTTGDPSTPGWPLFQDFALASASGQ